MQQLSEEIFIKQLKVEIERKVGFSITKFHDCKVLSELLKKQKIAVSSHTLARFFGLLKEGHRPYTSTLNLLAEFVGYASFARFCTDFSDKMEFALANPGGFSLGAFSFTALELCIATNDWKNFQFILDSYQIDHQKNDLSMFLGNAVRQHPNKDEFLNALIEIENGRHLFYECFVDEDDPGNYYSNALQKYYSRFRTNFENTLFQSCYLGASTIYRLENSIDTTTQLIVNQSIDYSYLHFHPLARLFEMRILLAPHSKIMQQVEEMLNSLDKFRQYEKCWILARTIKALAHTKQIRIALKNRAFSDAILENYREIGGEIKSIAELIIQLTVHSLLNQSKDELFPASRMREKHLNETNARIAVESATAYIGSNDAVKNLFGKNLSLFTKQTGQTWLNEMVY